MTKSFDKPKSTQDLANERRKYEQNQRELQKAGQFNQELPVKGVKRRPVSADEPDWYQKKKTKVQSDAQNVQDPKRVPVPKVA